MSVNKYEPHIFIIPEDDNFRQLVLGFKNDSRVNDAVVKLESNARGWMDALGKIKHIHMDDYEKRYAIALIDFDGEPDNRIDYFRREIPAYEGRAFLLGLYKESEDFKRDCKKKSLEALGMELAESCIGGGGGLWESEHLKCNAEELDRLRKAVGSFLFLE
ncbi:MAG: hypothetical protein LBI62_01480 [Candidatus Accumulibacter sp.]|jgi:hypothetical protein|nr:hypothetical protein [Accumulibacter sp.]